MFFKYNLYTILWAIVILLLTLTPGNALPTSETINIPNLDKVVHFFIFGVFAYLLVRGFTKQNKYNFLKRFSKLFSFIFSVLFGTVIEILQTTIPGRGFDFLDILANISGIALGLSVYFLKDK